MFKPKDFNKRKNPEEYLTWECVCVFEHVNVFVSEGRKRESFVPIVY